MDWRMAGIMIGAMASTIICGCLRTEVPKASDTCGVNTVSAADHARRAARSHREAGGSHCER